MCVFFFRISCGNSGCLFCVYGDVTIPGKRCKFYPMLGIYESSLATLPTVLWHGTSIYNGHLREPMTLTPIVVGLSVELSLHVPVLRLMSVATGIRTHKPFACGANALTHCTTAEAGINNSNWSPIWNALYIYFNIFFVPRELLRLWQWYIWRMFWVFWWFLWV